MADDYPSADAPEGYNYYAKGTGTTKGIFTYYGVLKNILSTEREKNVSLELENAGFDKLADAVAWLKRYLPDEKDIFIHDGGPFFDDCKKIHFKDYKEEMGEGPVDVDDGPYRHFVAGHLKNASQE